ncbi:caspase family protein [Bradyrhizobium manausense]|uniref:Caspase family p20 domain-containing protein n=1 Tax=Bradyrhizobium manausense TaxID=989370 RepID=A0A0R3DC73_9BRAD|nr:caspase family protein [Bradyrhizobium manausense]KRQ04932.1 hypothetical protein AOQ71_29205 [Bradyrhizobium manausense]
MLRLFVFFFVVLISSAVAQTSDPRFTTEAPVKRFAFVIGNADYATAEKLPGSIADAKTIASKLRNVGFDVKELDNFKDRDEFLVQFDAFLDSIRPGAFVVFYFSGHGFTYRGESYLVPLQFPSLVDADDVFYTFLSATALQDKINLRKPGLLLMLLDACRNVTASVREPGGGDVAVGKGLASLLTARNNIIGFSSAPGSTSIGSASGGLSKYTEGLAAHLTTPGIEINEVQRLTVKDVRDSTGGRQSPWMSSSFTVYVHFNPDEQTKKVYQVQWLAALDRDNERAVTDYLELYGLGPYANAARTWLAERSKKAATFTRLSPEEIDLSWTFAKGNGTVATVKQFKMPLGFERTASSALVGPDPGAPLHDRVASTFANQTAIALGPITGRAAPDATAPATTNLSFGDKIKVESYHVQSGIVWLKAVGKTSTSFWVPLPESGIPPRDVTIGSPLEEFDLLPGPGPALANEEQIDRLIVNRKGSQIKWVSIAMPERAGRSAAEQKAATEIRVRAAHAAYLISKVIPTGRISLVEGVNGIAEPRIRLFGN